MDRVYSLSSLMMCSPFQLLKVENCPLFATVDYIGSSKFLKNNKLYIPVIRSLLQNGSSVF